MFLSEALLMSTHNICFWRTIENYPRIIIKYSSLTSPLTGWKNNNKQKKKKKKNKKENTKKQKNKNKKKAHLI